MFEFIISCVIVLAISYCVALWLMRRHDDVLHGDFVHPELGTGAAPPPPFPKRPLAKQEIPASSQPARAETSETLQSLLAVIKRDLNDASRP